MPLPTLVQVLVGIDDHTRYLRRADTVNSQDLAANFSGQFLRFLVVTVLEFNLDVQVSALQVPSYIPAPTADHRI